MKRGLVAEILQKAVQSRDWQSRPQVPSWPRNTPGSPVLLVAGTLPGCEPAMPPVISYLRSVEIEQPSSRFQLPALQSR